MPPKKEKKVHETEPTAAAVRTRRSAAANAPAKAEPEPAAPAPANKTDTKSAPRKRGRPTKDDAKVEVEVEGAPEPPKKRGRPSKGEATAEKPDDVKPPPVQIARKTAKKAAKVEHEHASDEPHPRHEPPIGGETTKITGDEEAAAEQLEEELLDTAAAAAEAKGKGKASSKRRAPTKAENQPAKSAKKPSAPVNSNRIDGERQYWLMKAEQEDRFETAHDGTKINTKFTIDDLKAKTVPEPWDGVRNIVAAKNMKEMRKGDLAFFYASQGKQGRTPGITGVMEVVSEAEPDNTVSDPSAYGYVDKEADRGKWVVVGVEFRKKLSKPVSLKQLQEHRGPGGKLEGMQLFKQTRLSVGKVSSAEWDFISNELIEGYEE